MRSSQLRTWLWIPLALPLALALAPALAGAAPLLTLTGSVEARARVPAGYITHSDASHLTAGAVAGSVSDTRSAESEGSVATGDTSATAMFGGTAKFGELYGTASAGAIGGTAYSHVMLRFDDEFRATSSTLPFGAAVDYLFTLSLQSGIFATVDCDVAGPPGPAVASLSGNNGSAGIISDRACPGPPDERVVHTVLHTTIGGGWVLISGELNLSASVGSSVSTLPNVSAIVDASHTGRVYLDPIGEGYGYVTGSGRDYSTPIPEPGTGLLLGFGLALPCVTSKLRPAHTQSV